MIKILCIMLAKTADDQIRQMTDQALNTMFSNGVLKDYIEMKCVLVETNSDSPPYAQANVDTLYPNELEFRYNHFLNLGYERAKLFWPEFFADNQQNDEGWNETRYIVLTNNDIYFHEDWAWELAGAIDENGLDSGSPKSRGWQFHTEYDVHNETGGLYEGWGIGWQFTGWNQMYKYSSFEKLYPLDSDFSFWASDNSVALEMQKLGMRHALIASSEITHFTSSSHRLIPHGKHHEWTSGQCDILSKKINEGRYERN